MKPSVSIFLSSVDMPKLEQVPKSSSPGLVQPEAPLERLEACVPVSEPPASAELELPFLAPLTAAVTPPHTVANVSDRSSAKESTASSSSVGEIKPSLVTPQMPSTDKPLTDSPRSLAASPSPALKALNGLADSGAELDAVAHEPSLHPQVSAPAYRDASPSETLPSDMRPEVPIAAALSPLSPVAVVPVILTSSPIPALPVTLPPGLPPLVQATAEVDEMNKTLDTKDLLTRGGAEAPSGTNESKAESQQEALTRRSPTTGNVSDALYFLLKVTPKYRAATTNRLNR